MPRECTLVLQILALVLGFGLAQYAAGCQRPLDPPIVVPDGGTATDCEAAEANLERLGCTEGDGYGNVCELARDLPGVVDVACLASAADCLQASVCDNDR